MARSSPRTYDRAQPGVEVGLELRQELRRLANLFLLSGVTLAVVLLILFATALHVTLIPHAVMTVARAVSLWGWAMTLVYGSYVTIKARRWWWTALCLFPLTSVPCSVAYAWTRRMEIEHDVLGEEAPRQRQRRGGRRRA